MAHGIYQYNNTFGYMTILFLIFSSLVITDLPAGWQTDFEQAKSIAADQDKSILMVFAGSDWCAPCKKLKKNILTTDAFRSYEKENLVLLYLDFPSKRKNKLSKEQTMHNEALAAQYNQSGNFPKVVLLDNLGKAIKEIKYEGQDADDFIEEISKVK